MERLAERPTVPEAMVKKRAEAAQKTPAEAPGAGRPEETLPKGAEMDGRRPTIWIKCSLSIPLQKASWCTS
ncbi:MAG: hypothetical protein K2N94_00640 [Lachnospiraceae bacterium]|nr:hypothetical protein [Lachnospiraceae bacterium]